ncbi:nuclear transport factor 2 family protein [Ferrimonas sp. SCSIO 43195]|uniref:nuclear transport factor 2 family protein n=1 Tax=Ferrimonas sp. SCSIO 43195 TaxID=2822844 RepID=UPI00207564AE|nr:nuclear transport factor 2 family protein [Ferrimonas sp. SCSIO 43195]USD35821.1 nuclear transport factor 2 family protein [Ferrimonas sp. SCSIO 43195]
MSSAVTSINDTTDASLVQRFVALYQHLDYDSLSQLAGVYADDIEFVDPLHQVRGLAQLTDYFSGLYKNLHHSSVEITDVIQGANEAALYWRMTLIHPKLNGGRAVVIDGHSHLKFSNRIHYHRDYFDAGQMLYEQLPLLGPVIRAVKRRASQ